MNTEPVTKKALTVEDYDYSMLMFASASMNDERALYRTKWFDYRFMHPAEATIAYADTYVKFYRRFFRAHIDHKIAEYIQPIRHGDLFNVPSDTKKGAAKKSFIKGIWRGRQYADAFGMPYDLYIETALNYRLRYWRQRNLPRPNHLYFEQKGEDDMRQAWFINAMHNQWRDVQFAKLMFSTHPEFKTDRYVGTNEQNDHHEWLFDQVAKRSNKGETLARLVFKERVLPLEKVQARFEPAIFAQVSAAA